MCGTGISSVGGWARAFLLIGGFVVVCTAKIVVHALNGDDAVHVKLSMPWNIYMYKPNPGKNMAPIVSIVWARSCSIVTAEQSCLCFYRVLENVTTSSRR